MKRAAILLCAVACDASAPAKGMTVSRTEQSVTAVALTKLDEVAAPAGVVAIAPDSKTWATAGVLGVHVFAGAAPVSSAPDTIDSASTAVFSPDGALLRVAGREYRVATGAPTDVRAPADLAPWAKAQGLPAPPVIRIARSAQSADGALIVATGVGAAGTGREAAQQAPATGDAAWLFAFDGAWKPIAAMQHGPEAGYERIAVGAKSIALTGNKWLAVFARDALTARHELVGFQAPYLVAWGPGDARLAATHAQQVAVWRGGAWDAPATTFSIGDGAPSAIAFDPARALLAIGTLQGHVRIYGVADAQLAAPPLLVDQAVGAMVQGLAFAPSGDWLAVSTAAKALRFKVSASP